MPEKILSRPFGPLPTQWEGEFIEAFYRLFEGSLLYHRKNALIDQLAQKCLEAMNKLVSTGGRFSLKIVRDHFFLNNVRVQMNADQHAILRGFLNELRSRWIGEMEFKDAVNAEQLKDFVYLLSGLEENNEGNSLYLLQQLEYRGIAAIRASKLQSFEREEALIGPEHRKRQSGQAYFRSLDLVKGMLECVRSRKDLDIRKAKRLMQNVVNLIIQDEAPLLGLANSKNYGEFAINHPVNVAIYAIATGQRVGIPQMHLLHLGIAGLFHDIGQVKVPKEILQNSGALSPEELTILRSHPVLGAEILMGRKEWDELAVRMITTAFEHHLRYDATGYPKLTRKWKPSLFSRIIALADFYDFLVRPMVSQRLPYVSDKALGMILERSGKDFDPALIKVFINMIGVFPIGTLVLLNTDEIGIVARVQGDGEWPDRPEVCLLRYSDEAYRKGQVVDLKEREESTGAFKRTIVKTLNPNEYDIHVVEFFL